MKAIVMHETGGAEVLHYETFPTPKPIANEVLVKVHAATVNHTDIFHRSGQFYIQKSLPHILGMDVAGEIVELGAEVTDWQIGDRIVATFEALGRERNGAYAEYTTLPTNQLHYIPDGLSYIAAASIGLAFTTAWIALFDNGAIAQAERIVIHAASSGVGTSAIQIGHWQNAQVIAISDQNKAKRLHQLGADFVLDRHSPDLVEQVIKITKGQGASLVLDLVGRTTLRSSISMLAKNGRIVCAGTLSGDIAEINVMDLLMKNASIHGSFALIQSQDFEQILQHFAQGIFQPAIDSVLPLQKASVAHERIEAKQAFGKIVLVPDPEHQE
ncbi:MAG: zinc-binding dehydrogenase [Nostoc sp. DedSLP03]|uniref:quinone oxidoreductase family protein n=1 Tax=Nostoc sp. DedSLP03 TaxID=3075400 RepID=UPI002AD29B72|nr:zinc-binding dehydrogenase [Nostoc sp. DedSLP03]MDZ7967669.1 zinc-binding dehydrogenase [Nostoc sp. DedSLP03]